MKTSSETTGKKTLFVLFKQKGGTGGSTFIRVFCEILRRMGITVACYDGDGGVGHFVRFCGTKTNGKLDAEQDPLRGVAKFDIRQDHAKNNRSIMDLAECGHETVIIDLPAGAAEMIPVKDFEMWIKSGYQVVFINVVTPIAASFTHMHKYLDAYTDRAKYLAVLNLGEATDLSDFVLWHGVKPVKPGDESAIPEIGQGKTREKLMKYGGVELVMPKLRPGTYAKLDIFGLSFGDAEDFKKYPDFFKPSDRSLPGEFLDEVKQNLFHRGDDDNSTSVADYLGISA